MVRNAGMTRDRSSQTRFLTWLIISAPTMTSTGAAASDGTTWTSGLKNIATRNSTPVTTLARPVRAPSATPDGALDVGRVRRDAARATGRGGQRVDQQHRLRLGQVAVLVEQAALGADGGDRADGVEEVGDHDREDDEQRGEDADPLEAAEQREVADQREVGRADDAVGQRRHLQRPAARVDAVGGEGRADVGDRLDDDREHGGRDDPDEQRTLDLADDEHAGQQQADDEDQQRPAGELAVDAEADRDDALRARRMKPASTSPMIVRKKPMPTAIAVFSCGGMASKTAWRKPVSTRTRDEQALEHDQAHDLGPGQLGGRVDGDDRVDAQAGGQRERVAADDAHEDRHDAGDQRGHRGDATRRAAWSR